MKNIILFDDDQWKGMLPLCYTKPIAALRVGILTMAEKWSRILSGQVSYITQDYLSTKFSINISDDNIVINSRFLPSDKLVKLIFQLDFNDALLCGEILIAARMNESQFIKLMDNQKIDELKGIDLDNGEAYIKYLTRPHDIFSFNGDEIVNDFKLITKGRKSQDLPAHAIVSQGAKSDIFIEAGARINPCYLNTAEGQIYIGKNAEIMEGAMLRGPISIGDDAQVKMGAKIYGGTTIGPASKVGGELKNVVIQAYSNKAHDGFLGNSVIGEWCNIGADSNSSNLKNNYTEIKIWDYSINSFSNTGLQFCGLIMGDHSKAGINTMFNTGTMVGVSCNLFGSGFPRNFVPSFAWGGTKGYITFKIDKALELAEIVMKRRGIEMSDDDRTILQHVFHSSSTYRHWEN
jgi:UDP-N-acetylglucosamine diphosphorylase/glucosamine-1-phosphate N-acetyltransferase